MSQSPQRDDPTLDLEAVSSEELERVLVTLSAPKRNVEERVVPPEPKRRCDSAHREILRQPFSLD